LPTAALTMLVAVGFGVVSAAVGYYLSWVLAAPTGATMVVVASAFLLPGLIRLALRKNV